MPRPRLTRPSLVLALALSPLAAADWPMLGGRPDRNMVSSETGLPTEWNDGARGPKKNIKWTAPLGEITYGTPVIAGGRVFIGTDNDDPAIKEKRGVLKCLSEKDGSLLWRATHAKLEDPSEDETMVGVCSTPCVAGDRVYYVSNRAELVCRAVEDGREVWRLDMRQELGVTPNQASASSPLVVGDLVFVVTGQGSHPRTGVIRTPTAPSFIAVHRQTGRVAWSDNSPGEKIHSGQWGSPTHGVVDGQPQVLFPGGDGWLYSFEPPTGRLLWKFNCKVHEKTSADGKSETPFQLVSAPVFSGHRVIVAIGEPEASSGPGALRCIDARKRGDVTATAELWRLGGEDFSDSISTVAIQDGLVFATDAPGFLNCLDLETGRLIWKHDLQSNIWGSPLIADGKLYLQVGDGDVHVFTATREKKVVAKIGTLTDMAHGTPVAANGTLYFTGQKALYAITGAR